MHVRKKINSLLRPSHYQIVKVCGSSADEDMPLEIWLDDRVLGSRIAPERKHAWIIAAPKSGSTWLSALLKNLLGWPTVGLTSGRTGRREQEPDMRQIMRFPSENIFSPHQHCRASEDTLEFINRFHIKPIIQVRDVHDTVVSFRDHCLRETGVFSMAYIDREFARLSDEKQFQFIIDLVLPWYFHFYASWFQAGATSPDSLLFVNYEDLRLDPGKTLARILGYLDESRPEDAINGAIQSVTKMYTRKNQAVLGRGRLLLTERHRERIRELREYYPHIDFSKVGL